MCVIFQTKLAGWEIKMHENVDVCKLLFLDVNAMWLIWIHMARTRGLAYFLLHVCRMTKFSDMDHVCITYRGKVLLGFRSCQHCHDLIHFEDKQVSWNMAFGWRQAGTKYNSKTKAFVSTSSMLFVLAGYGGSLYESWMNGVWGEAKQK